MEENQKFNGYQLKPVNPTKVGIKASLKPWKTEWNRDDMYTKFGVRLFEN